MDNVRRMSNLLLSCVFFLVAGCVQTAECDRVTGCGSDAVCYNYECVETCSKDDACGSDEWCVPCQESEACLESGANANARVCVER